MKTAVLPTYLRSLVTGVPLSATDGTETLWGASELFTGHRDSDLKNWDLDLPEKPTQSTLVTVSEMFEKDGAFADIYGSLGDDLNAFRMSQAQIKGFARDHRDKLGDNGAFFLFTRKGEPVNADKSNVFVAYVYVRVGALEVRVNLFSDAYVWIALRQYRFVLPQL